jgi:hypothetical protein
LSIQTVFLGDLSHVQWSYNLLILQEYEFTGGTGVKENPQENMIHFTTSTVGKSTDIEWEIAQIKRDLSHWK